MKVTKLTLALLLLAVSSVHAISFTKYSNKLFTQEEYNTLIEKAALEIAKDMHFPERNFKEVYVNHQQEIIERSTPVILKKFLWLEKGYSTWPVAESVAGKRRKETYSREIQRGVRDALYADQVFLNKIFTINESDRIISFHSDIKVSKNGKLTVVETIKIYNGQGGSNDEIKRGIVRSFPTRYTTAMGFVSTVPFDFIEATRDGSPENYKKEKAENGVRIYFGKADEFLERGYYTYVLTYETAKQIIFHKENDELYWNVNGTGWSFESGKVSCRIVFPEQAKILENNCYTGVQGSVEKSCNFKITAPSVVEFSTQQLLNSNEGLTVSTTIAKGVLIAPDTTEKVFEAIKDNFILPAIIAALLFLTGMNYRAWLKVGRDPKAGSVFPQFEPPQNFSPADCGFLTTKSYKSHHFAASLVDYAVKRLVDIEVKEEGMIFKSPVYYFNKPVSVATESDILNLRKQWYGYDIQSLYGQKAEKGTYNSTIAAVYNGLDNHLKDRMEFTKGKSGSFKNLFTLNFNYVGWGILFLVLCVVGMIVYFILFNGTPLLVLSSIGLILAGIVIQILFARWLQAYSIEGRKILDHVLGFRMYLETTEQKKFDTMNPPDLTIQLFEKYLPYAIALECENQWSEKFETIINNAVEGGYQPAYFNMHGSNLNMRTFTSGLSSGISNTIASASTPPSSSGGGSGGGGSSGGGGGGGGGGGW